MELKPISQTGAGVFAAMPAKDIIGSVFRQLEYFQMTLIIQL